MNAPKLPQAPSKPVASKKDSRRFIAESGNVCQKRIRHSAFWLVLANYAAAFASMGINIVLANKLGPSGFGVFRFGIVVGTFVQCFVNLGSNRTIVRDLTHADDPTAMMSSSLALRFLSSMIVMFFGLILTLTIDVSGPRLFVAWMCGFAAVCTALTPKGWFDVQYKMHLHSVLLLVEKVVFAITTLAWAFGFAGQTLLFGAAVFWLISRLVGLACQFWLIQKTFAWTDGWNWGRIGWLTHETKWVFGSDFGGILASFGTQLVLGSFQGNQALAHYGMAFSMVAMGQLFIAQVDRLMAPKIASITKTPELGKLSLARQLMKFTGWAALGSITVSASLALVGPLAIHYLLAKTFEPSIEILQLLCIWSALLGINLVGSRFLICLRCHQYQFYVSIIRGVLAIAFAPLLVTSFGGKGVAMTMIFSALFFMIANYSFLLTTKRFDGNEKTVN